MRKLLKKWLKSRSFRSCAFFIGPILGGILIQAAEVTNSVRRIEFREPKSTAYLVDQTPGPAPKSQIRAPWTRVRRDDGSTDHVELGSRIVLHIDSTTDLHRLLAGRALQVSRQISSNFVILQAMDGPTAIDQAESLARERGVLISHPVMRQALKLHRPYSHKPNDPYFSEQWHLENRNSNGVPIGVDLNVRAAWPVSRGQGILVAIGDDGMDLSHSDLKTPTTGSPHFNFYLNKADGNPPSREASHGTAVGGLIAAQGDNGIGVSGVAPQASLASWVIFGTSFFGQDNVVDNETLMDMFQYSSNRVSVQNHSWGNATTSQRGLDSLSDIGVGNAVANGRGGKGIVIIRAGGNGREALINSNDDGFANDPRVIAVGAVRSDGRACSYSSPGACLLVAAPSGDPDDGFPNVMTTDRHGSAGYNATGSGDRADYAFDATGFNGTSASSPQIAGVAALILGANPNLTYRDVQQILIHSARQLDLSDPDLHTNSAGFLFSHNTGFGVPDAGFAVALARSWSNRPPAMRVLAEDASTRSIPDDALRVVVEGLNLTNTLRSIRCLPSLGPHADNPTAAVPLVYVGQANGDLSQDLRGKAALIQRGVSLFAEKVRRAAKAGAEFAIIYNNVNATEIVAIGGTTFSPIPAVSIDQNDGQALRDFLTAHPETTAQLKLTPAVYEFTVNETLICEHVGVRIKTNHRRRSDVRITLVSPSGTRSVLQTINSDTARGPIDWTYWSAQHFYECSAGTWRVEISDERNTSTGTGSVIYAALLIDGVPITDTDHDGLDDAWEMQFFNSLSQGPQDDPDHDGYTNAREQILGTSPIQAQPDFRIDISPWNETLARLSWPGTLDQLYEIWSNANAIIPLTSLAKVPGKFPETEFFVPYARFQDEFFQVRTLPKQ